MKENPIRENFLYKTKVTEKGIVFEQTETSDEKDNGFVVIEVQV